MSLHTGKPISIAAVAVAMTAFFTGCNESPNAPAPVTSAEARADLESLASKVKYFTPQDAGGGDLDIDGFEKRAAAKTSAASNAGAACEVESRYIDEYEDSDVGGGFTVQYDTTDSYTSANQPICAEADLVAYELTTSHSVNDMLETHIKTRTDFPANIFIGGDIKITGNGTVQYKDGYLITIASMTIVFNFAEEKLKKYVMNLTLEKGYTVVLQEAPGANMIAKEPTADEVAVSGPISKDGTVVGYFEVMGDDRVIIRDANKAIIESHG
jgi:hypothetical protein